MQRQRISYRRYLDVSSKHPAEAHRVTNRPRRRAAVAFSNNVPPTDDHFDLLQTRDAVLLTIAAKLFTRLALLRHAAQIIRTTSADRPKICRAIDTIDLEAARIASLAEDLLAAVSIQAKGLPT